MADSHKFASLPQEYARKLYRFAQRRRLRTQLFVLVAATTILSGLTFNVFSYVRERDFLIDLVESQGMAELEVYQSLTTVRARHRFKSQQKEKIGPWVPAFVGLRNSSTMLEVFGRAMQPEPTLSLDRFEPVKVADRLSLPGRDSNHPVMQLRTNLWDGMRPQVVLELVQRIDDHRWIHLAYILRDIDRHLVSSYLQNFVWVALTALITGLGLYWLVSGWFGGWIGQFTEKFSAVSEGRSPEFFDDRGADELDELKSGFNQMLLALQQNRDLQKNLAKVQQSASRQKRDYQTSLENVSEQAERMRLASLGHLTSGIAHEINNPLNYVSGALGPLRKQFEQTSDQLPEANRAVISELIDCAQDGIDRATEIVADLRSITRKSQLETDCSVENTWNEALRIVEWTHSGQCKLHLDHSVDVQISGVYSLYVQIWSNLILNAIEALPANRSIVNVYVTAFRDGDLVRVVVADDAGPLPVDRNAMFESGVTTKEFGSGIGLSFVRHTLQAMGGSIRALDGSAVDHSDQASKKFELTLQSSA